MRHQPLHEFIESFQKLEQEISLGTAKSFSFFGGPFDGHAYNISSRFGTPLNYSVALPIDGVMILGKPVKSAFYEYSIEADIFLFTGKIEEKVFELCLDSQSV
jgi:hypothetical protein